MLRTIIILLTSLLLIPSVLAEDRYSVHRQTIVVDEEGNEEVVRARGFSDRSIWVSLERNMKCANGLCGHCQLGPLFVCRDGPVFRYEEIADWLGKRGF